jgi:hypothetical protein
MNSLILSTLIGLCVASKAGKRGYVADDKLSTPGIELLTSADWYYSYNLASNYGPGAQVRDNAFVPMNWCVSTFNESVPTWVNTTFYLGVNEPNNIHNCNLPGREVAIAWKSVMDLYGPMGTDSILVSPATAGNGIPWFADFFGNCTELYPSSPMCGITHMAVHDYTCNVSTLDAYLKSVYAIYKMPIWLTEFSCGDGAQKNPTSRHLAYMKQVFPYLDASPIVFRYAWMSASDKSNLRGLVEEVNGVTQLSQVGQLYNSL